MSDQTLPRVLATPLKPALMRNCDQTFTALIRVQAPEGDASAVSRRRPLHVALVIDRSGSMSGEPLHEAIRCARRMVDRLRPQDRAAIVSFDDRVRTLLPAMQIGDGRAQHAALESIRSGGSTNLYGGWFEGRTALLDHREGAALSRVVLLSDGNANAGRVTDSGEIIACCMEAAQHGVTTSTYGLGYDFNEDLMVGMARGGQGSHYYGETAADLMEPFEEEFDLLQALCVREVELRLRTPQGIGMRVLNDVPVRNDGQSIVVRMRDLAYGAEAWIAVELKVPARLSETESVHLLDADAYGRDIDGRRIHLGADHLQPRTVSLAAWDALASDALVSERLAEVRCAALLQQARNAAARDDWPEIQRLLAEAQQRYAAFPWAAAVIANMLRLAETRNPARFRKEALYSSRRMDSRLAAICEPLFESDLAQPRFMMRRAAQGSATDPETPPSQSKKGRNRKR